MSQNVLIVAAHPDDEILGCGGAIARHTARGDIVNILILAEGATSRMGIKLEDCAELRRTAMNVAKALGAQPPLLIGLPDNCMDEIARLTVIQHIETYLAQTAADTVYTHHGGDLNVDHRRTHEAVITACRPLPGSQVKRVYSFETVSSTEWSTPDIGRGFRPSKFINITNHWPLKRKAMELYKHEMRPFPHARSIEAVEALATLRGSQVGCAKAEGFEVLLELED